MLLVVNTASFCGFTRQYEGLQKLWERYEGKGLVVLGVPSNDFGWQEPKSESEILGFCQGAFNVTFPLTTKQSVRGEARTRSIAGRGRLWGRTLCHSGTFTSIWWGGTASSSQATGRQSSRSPPR